MVILCYDDDHDDDDFDGDDKEGDRPTVSMLPGGAASMTRWRVPRLYPVTPMYLQKTWCTGRINPQKVSFICT